MHSSCDHTVIHETGVLKPGDIDFSVVELDIIENSIMLFCTIGRACNLHVLLSSRRIIRADPAASYITDFGGIPKTALEASESLPSARRLWMA